MGNHIYFKNFIDCDETHCKYSFYATPERFYFHVEVENENYIPKGTSTGYSQDETQITLFFGSKQIDVPLLVYAFFNQNGGRMLTNEASSGKVVDNRDNGFSHIQDSEIKSSFSSGLFTVDLSLSWDSIHIDISDRKFLFDFSIKLIKDYRRQIVCLNAGKWMDFQSSFWLAEMELITNN